MQRRMLRRAHLAIQIDEQARLLSIGRLCENGDHAFNLGKQLVVFRHGNSSLV